MIKTNFLAIAIENLKTTGAVWESSNFLIKKMVEPIELSKKSLIVELGTGNGCVTREILKNMSEDAQLHAFEINPLFYKQTAAIGDHRLSVRQDSAEHIDQFFPKNSVDVVFSSLPLALIPTTIKDRIIQQVYTCLKQGGMFVQYQYTLKDRKTIKALFSEMNLRFTLLNLPPAFVYVCKK